MKRILFLLVILIAIGSLYCRARPNSIRNQVSAAEMMTPAEQEAFLTTYSGEWLKQSYYDELIKTKSPLKAIKTGKDWPFFKITSEPSHPNEFYITTLSRFYNFRGAYLPCEKRDSLVFMSDYDKWKFKLKFPRNEKNVAYWSENYPEGMDKYIRFANLDSVLNAIVIAGTYINNDVTPAKQVEFKVNGTIEGLDKISKYEVLMDCSSDKSDLIWAQDWLFYIEMKDNVLYIYQGEQDYYDDESFDFNWIKGALIYTLTKKK